MMPAGLKTAESCEVSMHETSGMLCNGDRHAAGSHLRRQVVELLCASISRACRAQKPVAEQRPRPCAAWWCRCGPRGPSGV